MQAVKQWIDAVRLFVRSRRSRSRPRTCRVLICCSKHKEVWDGFADGSEGAVRGMPAGASLAHVSGRIEELARRAVQESPSYEHTSANSRSRSARLDGRIGSNGWSGQSDLPIDKSLTCFDMKRLPAKVARRCGCCWTARSSTSRDVFAFGRSGSGKTHLSCAIAQELVALGPQGTFQSLQSAVQDLLIAKRD